MGIAPPGLGAPGALAEYMIVDDVRHLVPLGDLDPVASVSLTDAGLTPYHAIVSSLHALPAGSTAVLEIPTPDPGSVRDHDAADQQFHDRPGVLDVEPSTTGATLRLASGSYTFSATHSATHSAIA